MDNCTHASSAVIQCLKLEVPIMRRHEFRRWPKNRIHARSCELLRDYGQSHAQG